MMVDFIENKSILKELETFADNLVFELSYWFMNSCDVCGKVFSGPFSLNAFEVNFPVAISVCLHMFAVLVLCRI
jgi:hypothetical protein